MALELAGAFSNDGFKLRDGHWAGTLAPNESKIIAVNLYAGNEYWFSAGATERGETICGGSLRRNRRAGRDENFNSRHESGCWITVTNSGQYFVRVRLAEGEAGGSMFRLQLQMKPRVPRVAGAAVLARLASCASSHKDPRAFRHHRQLVLRSLPIRPPFIATARNRGTDRISNCPKDSIMKVIRPSLVT